MFLSYRGRIEALVCASKKVEKCIHGRPCLCEQAVLMKAGEK